MLKDPESRRLRSAGAFIVGVTVFLLYDVSASYGGKLV
jgi:hypothetical protein